MRERTPSRDWGLMVHSIEAWPVRTVSYGGEYRTIDARPELHTVQAQLHLDTIEDKRFDLVTGLNDWRAVSVVVIDGIMWVIDGHHLAAAAWSENLPLRIFVHTAPGSETIGAPRLV